MKKVEGNNKERGGNRRKEEGTGGKRREIVKREFMEEGNSEKRVDKRKRGYQ